MESKKQLANFLHTMDTTNIELLDKSLINDTYSNFRLLGIGKETEAQKKRRAKIKTTVKDAGKSIKDKLDGGKAVHAANKVNPVFITMRGSLLGMLNVNLFGTATNMSAIKNDANQKYWNDITQKFWMWGGDKSKISEAVDKGKTKKRLGQNILDKIKKQRYGIDGYSEAEGKGAENAGLALGVTAALGGATASALALDPVTLPAAGWVGAGSAALGVMSPIFSAYAKSKGASSKEVADVEKDVAPIVEGNRILDTPDLSTDDDKILGINKTAFWIGIGVIVLVGGYFGYKKIIAKK